MRDVAFWCFLLVMILTFPGCATTVEHEVTAPQLDGVGDAIKKIVIKDCAPPKLAMPALPDQARIIIKGTHLEADDNGILLLRSYVKARELLK